MDQAYAIRLLQAYRSKSFISRKDEVIAAVFEKLKGKDSVEIKSMGGFSFLLTSEVGPMPKGETNSGMETNPDLWIHQALLFSVPDMRERLQKLLVNFQP